ncbi:MAG: sigma-54-dependent transcriptional regulator [Candidatus Rokuibacteriota bacterium]
MTTILIVDDESAARLTMALLLRRKGHRVLHADGATAAVKVLGEEVVDLVITDLRMPDGSGLDVLRAAKANAPDTSVILLTAYAGWESAKEAIQLGALDYFEKGRDPDELLHRIDKALEEKALREENENLRQQIQDRYGLPGIIARSAEMRGALDLVARVAPTDATVLIRGESGTGKELIAKAIHHASQRARGPFVAVNCGAVPESLLESELFGHVKGAFTGAAVAKKGLFEEAHQGTLFLDEIGEMTPALQVKVLRALQDGEIRPVGSTQPITVDVRVLVATHRDLEQMIHQGTFREDLFYRLNVIVLPLAPLRDRREDIPVLAEHFLDRHGSKLGRQLRLSAEALDRLLAYPWPGNVRELENAMERSAILSRTETVGPDDLPPHVAAGTTLGRAPALPAQQTLSDVERAHVLQTLERCGWNHSRTAEALGIGRTTLWRKLKEYGLERAPGG